MYFGYMDGATGTGLFYSVDLGDVSIASLPSAFDKSPITLRQQGFGRALGQRPIHRQYRFAYLVQGCAAND